MRLDTKLGTQHTNGLPLTDVVMKKYIKETIEIETVDVDGLGTVTRGMKVKHPFFGIGEIVSIFESPDATKSLGIDFVGVGYKVLVPQHAKLEPVAIVAGPDKEGEPVKSGLFGWLKRKF